MDNDIVYEVICDYSTDDGESVETFIFDSYEKAVRKFKEIIEDEKQNTYWIKDALNSKDYVLDTNINDAEEDDELWWYLYCKQDSNMHDYLDLRIKEVE